MRRYIKKKGKVTIGLRNEKSRYTLGMMRVNWEIVAVLAHGLCSLERIAFGNCMVAFDMCSMYIHCFGRDIGRDYILA
jgi:hypothetical protein